MTPYNREQIEALRTVRGHLGALSAEERRDLHQRLADYLAFRSDLQAYLDSRFGSICTETCFRSRLSACCTREGIIVFFADVVVNALTSSCAGLDALEHALQAAGRRGGAKCVFLSESGCLWQMRPIVCAMFLCDAAKESAFGKDPDAAARWGVLEARRREFTWPDKPVLFDELERLFLEAGIRSPLMHLHFSPGLLRVKKMAGLCP